MHMMLPQIYFLIKAKQKNLHPMIFADLEWSKQVLAIPKTLYCHYRFDVGLGSLELIKRFDGDVFLAFSRTTAD